MNLICFSGRIGCGKTSLANKYSREQGYTVINFADGLKNIVCGILNVDRKYLDRDKDVQCEYSIDPVILQHHLPELDVPSHLPVFTSIRHILQFVGTDLIRVQCPDWHTIKVKKQILTYPEEKWVIGDCRFRNEKQMVEALGGVCWFIIRPSSFNDVCTHLSENELDNTSFEDDRVLVNNGTLESLILKMSENTSGSHVALDIHMDRNVNILS